MAIKQEKRVAPRPAVKATDYGAEYVTAATETPVESKEEAPAASETPVEQPAEQQAAPEPKKAPKGRKARK